MLNVLEHIKDPIRAVGEMHRILKKGGKIFVYVPSIYPYHARKGFYPDYWRFFDDTLLFLFDLINLIRELIPPLSPLFIPSISSIIIEIRCIFL